MKKEVLISIRGTQKMDGEEPQTVELVTGGTLSREDGVYSVSYVESEVTGMEGVNTTFEIRPEKIILSRSGKLDSTMIFEPGKKNESLYDMGFGALLVGVNARFIESELDDNGGRFAFDYQVEIEHEPIGVNEYEISVRTKSEGLAEKILQ